MRKLLIVIIGLTAWLHPVHADVEMPADLPTIEALISLHKLMKAEEDKAMEKIAVSFGEQSVVTKGAKLFNDARTTLDSKLSNTYSYMLLAATLASTSTSLYQLIRDYAKFTGEAARTFANKPMVGWYYAEAVYACAREIKNIKALYATMSASDINIMKASMDEKMNMLFQLKTYIDNMHSIIDHAYTWCSIVAVGGFKHDYIWDILNSEVKDKIAEDIINKWYSV